MEELSLMEDAVHYLDVSGNLQCIKDAAADFQFMLKVCFLFNNSLFLIHLWLPYTYHGDPIASLTALI